MKYKTITDIFAEKKNVNIGYIVAGYPSTQFTKEFLTKLDDSAIDILEIGIPYSDPLADGKHIAEASFAASQAGVTTDVVFDLLNSVKEKVHKPLVFLVYYNLVFAYGVEAFVKRSAEVGIKGMIIPDLPYEEATEVAQLLNAHNIAFIPLVFHLFYVKKVENPKDFDSQLKVVALSTFLMCVLFFVGKII